MIKNAEDISSVSTDETIISICINIKKLFLFTLILITLGNSTLYFSGPGGILEYL